MAVDPVYLPWEFRSPYLSSWMFTINGTNIGALWPTTSAHQPSDQAPSLNSLNLPVLVRVDNTSLISQAGPMQFNLTFLNPIEPGDWVKQSIPFSYISLTAKSLDGAATCCAGVFGRQLRMDVSGSKPGDSVFNEISTQAEWGTLHYAMKSFLPYHAISASIQANAGSRRLGCSGTSADPAINYTDLSGATQQRSLFYKTQYSDDTSLIVDFLDDFTNASSRAQQLDSKILEEAAPISGLLGDLVSLATAQSDVMAFMKNVGGSKTNRVNAVETLYSAFPAFMYIDPKLGGLLLEPLFQLQAPPIYTNPYAAPDLGTNYPNVTISNSTHDQGVERWYRCRWSCTVITDLTYSLRRFREYVDHDLCPRLVPVEMVALSADTMIFLTSWADYLCNSTLLIRDQCVVSVLRGMSCRSTIKPNLAIKGIVAIKAMSEMSSIVKQAADANKYSGTAAIYGQTNSWSLGYNLFADVWLNTGVVESSVYDGQSSFINNLTLTSTFSKFGVPVDNLGSDTGAAMSSWNLFVAAMTSNQDLRTNLISRVHNRASYNKTAGVFPIEYDSTIGITILGGASPAQGAVYAPLALKAPVLQITANLTTTTGTVTSSKSHSGAIAGGVTGGLAVLLAIGTIAFHHFPENLQTRAQSALIEAVPLDVGPQTEWQQQLAHRPFFPEYSPYPAPPVVSIPVGLSSKELAQLRSNASRSQSTDRRPSDLSLTATTDGGVPGGLPAEATSPSEARRLRSEVDLLRHEVLQLRAERSEAPPTYVSGEASEDGAV
ncbi:hypothetical protein H4582DRAFT_2080813 [Lactarius indigo]|nr:hypothetical protein H4582DRAFT_2080813 [Lactarius indigo]